MTKYFFKSILNLSLLISVLVTGCGRNSAPSRDGRVLVAVSILPLADFTREVGGNRVEVKVLVQPAHSPHTFEPTALQLEIVSKARALVLNGVGLEFWSDKLVSAADNPDLAIVRTGEGLEIIDNEHREESGNPHVWLDPVYAQHQVDNIAKTLSIVDPEGVEIYEKNARRYNGELKLLDREIREKVAGFSSKKFISFHSGFAYFARRYGLEEAGVIEKTPGAEPSPSDIADIINTAKSVGAKAIFAEPQFPPKSAEVIAAECGAVVSYLNPLGEPPDYKYVDIMRYNVSQLEKALK
ncbi:metal ABC transporter substrate-binding protein [candidate division KSB1 bacterium]